MYVAGESVEIGRIHAGGAPVVTAWLERLLKWMLITVTVSGEAIILLGSQLVPLLLGPAYRPVAANLVPLVAALFTLSFGSVARLGALALDRRLGGAVTELTQRRMFSRGVGELFVLPTGRHPIAAVFR